MQPDLFQVQTVRPVPAHRQAHLLDPTPLIKQAIQAQTPARFQSSSFEIHFKFQFKIKTEDGDAQQSSNSSSLNSNGNDALTNGEQIDLKNVATSLQQSYLDALSPANSYAYPNVAASFRAQAAYPTYYPPMPGME